MAITVLDCTVRKNVQLLQLYTKTEIETVFMKRLYIYIYCIDEALPTVHSQSFTRNMFTKVHRKLYQCISWPKYNTQISSTKYSIHFKDCTCTFLSTQYDSKMIPVHFIVQVINVYCTFHQWTNYILYIIYYILYRSIVSPNLTCTFLGLSTPYNPCSSATKSNSEHDLRALLYPRGKRKIIFVDITSDKMLPGVFS